MIVKPEGQPDPTSQAQGTRRMAGLHAMARELRAWLAELPQWDPLEIKSRQGFLEDRARAEQRLRTRLRRLPDCTLNVSATSTSADLTLAGVTAHSEHGLVGVCAAWAAKAEEVEGSPHGSVS